MYSYPPSVSYVVLLLSDSVPRGRLDDRGTVGDGRWRYRRGRLDFFRHYIGFPDHLVGWLLQRERYADR